MTRNRTTFTLTHGVIARDGVPMLTLIRARWGDGAPAESDLDNLSARIVELLNRSREITK